MYNRAEKGLQRRKGGKAREWMRERMRERECGLQEGGREKTLPRRMIERGGEEAELPQMK